MRVGGIELRAGMFIRHDSSVCWHKIDLACESHVACFCGQKGFDQHASDNYGHIQIAAELPEGGKLCGRCRMNKASWDKNHKTEEHSTVTKGQVNKALVAECGGCGQTEAEYFVTRQLPAIETYIPPGWYCVTHQPKDAGLPQERQLFCSRECVAKSYTDEPDSS